MKLILSIIFVMFSCNSFAQSKSIKHLCAEKMYFDEYLSNCDVVRKPLGKDVEVNYDTFFKSYQIIWTDEKGVGNEMKLYFKYEKPFEGLIYYTEDEKVVVVSDHTITDRTILIELLYLKKYSETDHGCGYGVTLRIPNVMDCN